MKSVDDLTSRLIALMFFFCLGGVKFHTLPKKKKRESPNFSDFCRWGRKSCFAKCFLFGSMVFFLGCMILVYWDVGSFSKRDSWSTPCWKEGLVQIPCDINWNYVNVPSPKKEHKQFNGRSDRSYAQGQTLNLDVGSMDGMWRSNVWMIRFDISVADVSVTFIHAMFKVHLVAHCHVNLHLLHLFHTSWCMCVC